VLFLSKPCGGGVLWGFSAHREAMTCAVGKFQLASSVAPFGKGQG